MQFIYKTLRFPVKVMKNKFMLNQKTRLLNRAYYITFDLIVNLFIRYF